MNNKDKTTPPEGHPSFILEHIPEKESIKYSIGPYQVLGEIGKGGMGEVLLAYDTVCGRRLALKKIRTDLLSHKQMHRRFIKEARITSQLTHPAIIPIYTIQDENNVVYYTMPYVQGETLKKIIRTTAEQERKGESLHHIGGSIPALIRVFIHVCQAIAYAHSKGVLHRDLKPENVIIGDYGEVLILDWGLAKLMRDKEEEEETEIAQVDNMHELTRLGKVVGTVTFMAPERGKGEQATVQTEIFALGVMLYQLLTLQPPFIRSTLEDFRKNMDREVFQEPSEIAPYRDVPRILSRIVKKCLDKAPQNRYQTVNALIRELENYIEGRSDWFQIADLDIKRKEDWEFQEHVLLTEHIAITRGPEVSEWVSLMVSKASFTGNTKLEAKLKVGPEGDGLGFLLNIPETAERKHLNVGYCLWLGSDINKSTKLVRSTVEVLHAPEIFLEREKEYLVRLEKIDHNLFFYLNDELQFSYMSHVPLVGTHIGLLCRDANYTLEGLTIFVGSQNITVNCLAVPDAFLAHKDYTTALSEYRRIGYSFPGRVEGREAMFRAGITLLEQGIATSDPKIRERLFEDSLEEFEKLHSTPGAPLEYLGKAHVYRALQDYDEEIKCFELAFRRYPNHPLLPILQEQILYRMHESSHFHRQAAYNFILTAVRHLPKTTIGTNARKLFTSLEKHWEHLPFILESKESEVLSVKNQQIAIQLSFWLAKPYILIEIIDELAQTTETSYITISNALYCLIELGAVELAVSKMDQLAVKEIKELELLILLSSAHTDSLESATQKFISVDRVFLDDQEWRAAGHLLEIALDQKQMKIVFKLLEYISAHINNPLHLECYKIWAYLIEKNWAAAGELLHKHPLEGLTGENSLLHTLYGCWLYATEGKEIAEIHFKGVLEVTYPRSSVLLSHYLNGNITEDSLWYQQAFLWEKRQLYRQLALFYSCAENPTKAAHFADLASAESLKM
jgi:serine/threonine protein kinase